MGWHSLCQHVVPAKIISRGGGEGAKFHCPIMRVQLREQS